MKLEVNIQAGSLAKQDLLTGLSGLIPMQYIEVTAGKHNGHRYVLNFFIEANEPDGLLQKIAAVISKIEKRHPGEEQGIYLHVRNIEGSEPGLNTRQHGKPFYPVAGIRIIPWNGRSNTTVAAHDILLEPSHAFGTGLHPSTRLCLQLLKLAAGYEPGKKLTSRSVLDIGCGSGILTIASLRLGAARALGIEINPEAVQTARRNIQLNRLENQAQISECSWQKITGTHDLILANLVPSVLFKAAPFIAELLSEQGLLIAAGFPESKNRDLLGVFEKNGLGLIDESFADGWGALLLTK